MNRLKIVSIGAGNVFYKYLLPAIAKRNDLDLVAVVDLQTQEKFNIDFAKYLNDFGGKLIETAYFKVDGSSNDCIRKLQKFFSDDTAVFINLPAISQYKALENFVSGTKAKIFVEKPAAFLINEVKKMEILIKENPLRVFFSERYLQGRAQPLLKILSEYKSKLGKIISVEGRLEEGQKYYNQVPVWFTKTGPGLDLCYHLLSIGLTIFKDGNWKLEKVVKPKSFDKGFGVKANLKVDLPNSNKSISFKLVAGKRRGRNKRFLKLVFEKGEIWQEYTSGNQVDPIYFKKGEVVKKIFEMPESYNAYDCQLEIFKYWFFHPYTIAPPVETLRLCLNIRKMRMMAGF